MQKENISYLKICGWVYTIAIFVTISAWLTDVLFFTTATKWILLPVALITTLGTIYLLLFRRNFYKVANILILLTYQLLGSILFSYVAFVLFKRAGESVLF